VLAPAIAAITKHGVAIIASLMNIDGAIAQSDAPPDGSDGGQGGPEGPPDDDGGKGGPEEPPVSSGNGEPNVEGSGNLPQAQAQQGVVEVSLDDIDDGAGEPPTLIGGRAAGTSRVPHTRSRGGIILDATAGPPELVPFLAGSAHGALQPTPSA
jgi:hypothetical protein